MPILTVKDINEKEFSFDVSKICDINGDVDKEHSSIKDSQRNRVRFAHDVQYVNKSGEAIDSLQLITDMSSGKVNVVALDVDLEATHSGKNHNYCVYYEDSMEKDAESFTNPFRKPMLKNHNSWSEPLGRIRQATHGPSNFTDERSAISLKIRVTDHDAIPKFIDGRYSTVSIGGTMGTVTCNICGKTILKDNKFSFCGHWKGETYKDQVCYWGARDIEYNEVSTVNNPADDFAQVIKITVLTDEDLKKDNDNKEGADNMDGQENKTTTTQTDATKPERDQLINLIDKLLGTPAQKTEEPEKENKDTTEGKDDNNKTEDSKTGKTVEDLQKELDEANKKAADLTQEVEGEKTKVADAIKAKEDAEKDALAFKDQCVELAIANKKMIADKVIELEKSQNKLEDDKTEDRKQELVGMSMKDLHSTLDAAKVTKDSAKRQQGTSVTNPTVASGGEKNSTIVDKDGNPIAEDSTKNKEAKDSNKNVSIDDITRNFINKLKR